MSESAQGASQLREVRATFADPAQMQAAADKLTMAGFDRADLSLPTQSSSLDESSLETAAKPASTESDSRQARTLGSSTAAAAVALAAAGVTIATGGAAAPAVAAAVLAGGAAGGATFAATGAIAGAEQHEREAQAAGGGLVLSVRTLTKAKQAEAIAVLKAAGATNVETLE